MRDLKEIWKPIKRFEGYYEVSNKGNIKSLQRVIIQSNRKILKKEKYLKLTPNSNGYILIRLFKGARPINVKAHILVAEAFVPNPENKPQVNHKDGIKINNIPDNLEWCTNSENTKHAYNLGLKNPKNYKGSANTKSILTEDIVRKIRDKYKKGGYSYNFFAKKYNVSISTIGAIITRKNWNHI